MNRRIINVNADGASPDGEAYQFAAKPDMVEKGYMVNEPVVLRYPSGDLQEGTRVLITPDGLEWLKREVPVEIREPQGTA